MSLAPGDLLSIPQVQKIVPLGRTTLYELVESGRLPAYRVTTASGGRGRVLVHRRDLEAFVPESRLTATRAPVRVDVDGLRRKVRRA